MKKLPTKLEKQTVLDSISEIIFKEARDIEVLFSDIYILLKNDGWEFEKLPVMDIPENIRKGNSSFDKTPHYVFTSNGKRVFIGPRVMAFSYDASKSYNGWSNYRKELSAFYDLLTKSNDETNIDQVSLNFIDFFKNHNIYDHITLSVDDNALESIYPGADKGKTYITELDVDDLNIRIKIENDMSLSIKGSDSEIEGSMIDIEVSKIIKEEDILDVYDEMHKHSKNIFFTLLSDTFIKTLNPTY